jgi:Mlc titration factor MtfA (ptsG expression regulator)
VKTVLIFPQAFDRKTSQHGLHDQERRGGEAWQGGPIVLSWNDVLRSGNRDQAINIVVHEFAHHLDGLDGEMGGTPIFENSGDQQKWKQVLAVEFEDLSAAAERGQWTILDHYGAKNKAEFFAVASESYFEIPDRLQAAHPELYELLRRYYRMDPAHWIS